MSKIHSTFYEGGLEDPGRTPQSLRKNAPLRALLGQQANVRGKASPVMVPEKNISCSKKQKHLIYLYIDWIYNIHPAAHTMDSALAENPLQDPLTALMTSYISD